MLKVESILYDVSPNMVNNGRREIALVLAIKFLAVKMELAVSSYSY